MAKKQWLKSSQDLQIFDKHIYDEMEKWYPNQSFEWYMTEIVALYETLYI